MRNLAARAAMWAKSGGVSYLTGFDFVGSEFYENGGIMYTPTTNTFSTNNYNRIKGSNDFDFSTFDTFELKLALLTNLSNNAGASIFDAFKTSGLSSCFYANFEYVNYVKTMVLVGYNSSGSQFLNLRQNYNFAIGSKVYLKFTYDSSTGYAMYYSSDGETYNLVASSGSTTKIRSKSDYFMLGGYPLSSLGANSLCGHFYESECSFTANGVLLWKGA